jgi:hypothetical protein
MQREPGGGERARRCEAEVDEQEPGAEQRRREDVARPARLDPEPVRHCSEQEAEDEAREEAVEEEIRMGPWRRKGPRRRRVPAAVASGEVDEPPGDGGHTLQGPDEEERAVRRGGEDREPVHSGGETGIDRA